MGDSMSDFYQSASAVNLKIDIGNVIARLSPCLYGTGMEDVNHEIYGGLDAQRLFGESFEEPPRADQGYSRCHGVSSAWFKAEQTDDACFLWSETVFHQGKVSQGFDLRGGTAAIANMGLNGWGIPVKQGRKMTGHIWVRGKADLLTVALQDRDGDKIYATAEIPTLDDEEWHCRDFELEPDSTDAKARFRIYGSGEGTVYFDDVYLADEPANEFGRIGCREDIVAAFQQQKLQFLRWGGTMANAKEYKLKNMRGKGERMPYDGFWYQKSSGGFGPYEFVRMSAALKLPCALSISRDDTVEDAVAFAEWTKQFDIPICVEIGNEECVSWFGEDNIESYRKYFANIERLVLPMRKANPKLTFASAAWWVGGEEHLAWMEECFRSTDGLVEYWDIHVQNPTIATALVGRDCLVAVRDLMKRLNPKTTMKIAVFEENGNNHSLERALAHAVTMTYIRELGDDLLCCCGANALQPYLQNDNWWDQGQIFFTPDKVWLQPYGWARQMGSANHRELVICCESSDKELYLSATMSADGSSVVLHIVNGCNTEKPLLILGLNGWKLNKATSLHGSNIRMNNIPLAQERCVPQDITSVFTARPVALPYSYTVLEFYH